MSREQHFKPISLAPQQLSDNTAVINKLGVNFSPFSPFFFFQTSREHITSNHTQLPTLYTTSYFQHSIQLPTSNTLYNFQLPTLYTTQNSVLSSLNKFQFYFCLFFPPFQKGHTIVLQKVPSNTAVMDNLELTCFFSFFKRVKQACRNNYLATP